MTKNDRLSFLPQGYRPLAIDETTQYGDLMRIADTYRTVCDCKMCIGVQSGHLQLGHERPWLFTGRPYPGTTTR